MVSVNNTSPDEGQPQAHNAPPIDVDAELDRVRPTQGNTDSAFEGHEEHGHTTAGVSAKVMFVRTVGEIAGMALAWVLAKQVMNEMFAKTTGRIKDAVAEKVILPRLDTVEKFFNKCLPGAVGKELAAARKTGDAQKIAREYAPYVTDLPVAVAASFGGKVWAQEEMNKRLDVPLQTHENLASAFVDNVVQLGSFVYLASPAGAPQKQQLNTVITKMLKPHVKEADLANFADFCTNLQVPNLLAFGASSAYLLKQALGDDPEQNK